MGYCTRIRDNCENKCYTIWDTNSFINYMKYLTYKDNNRYQVIYNDFQKFLKDLCNKCCSKQKLYCSETVLEKELKRTLFAEVPFLNNLSQIKKYNFIALIEQHLIIEKANRNLVNALRTISDDFTRNQLPKVKGWDRTLLAVALQLINYNPNNQLVIVTSDNSFLKLISYLNSNNSYRINNLEYNTSNIRSISYLGYLTPTYRCCLFKDLHDLKFNDILRKSFIYDKKKKRILFENFFKWNDKVFSKADTAKQQRRRAIT